MPGPGRKELRSLERAESSLKIETQLYHSPWARSNTLRTCRIFAEDRLLLCETDAFLAVKRTGSCVLTRRHASRPAATPCAIPAAPAGRPQPRARRLARTQRCASPPHHMRQTP